MEIELQFAKIMKSPQRPYQIHLDDGFADPVRIDCAARTDVKQAINAYFRGLGALVDVLPSHAASPVKNVLVSAAYETIVEAQIQPAEVSKVF